MLKRFFIFFALLIPILAIAQPRKKFPVLYTQADVGVELRYKNAEAINTSGLNFSPTYYQNGLVYVSQKQSGPIDPNTGQRFFELFFAPLDPNGEPLKPSSFSIELNSQLHEGPVTFNRRSDKIYITRSNIKGNISTAGKDGKVQLKVYEATRGNYDWENVTELPFNNDDYTCMHPTLSPDGRKLFFASNKPGGYGGMDLYFVERKDDNSWSIPINLGPTINTDQNEVFPFFHKSGLLFFSSNGHKGFGGLDMFLIDLSKNEWGKAMNMGEPFNSRYDDLGFIMNDEGNKGFFTSNRKAHNKGGDDIYFFEAAGGFKDMKLPNIVGTPVFVYDANSTNDLAGATIHFYEMTSTGVNDGIKIYNPKVLPKEPNSDELKIYRDRKRLEDLEGPKWITNENGEALLPFEDGKDFLIIIFKDGYVTKEIEYSTRGIKKGEPLEVLLEKSDCVVLKGSVFIQESEVNIPNAKVTIVNRCDNTKEVTMTNIKGEFESCLRMGCSFDIIIQKGGFAPTSTNIDTKEISNEKTLEVATSLVPKNDLAVKEPIKKGSVLVLNNIYYDFNKSHIQKGAAPDLQSLSQLMLEYPSMKVELRAHTDCRGEEGYNRDLSLKRAESAKQQLVNAGIAPNRISAIGLGESSPLNHCIDNVDCTEEEHQQNRRTEVKILDINEPIQVNKMGSRGN